VQNKDVQTNDNIGNKLSYVIKHTPLRISTLRKGKEGMVQLTEFPWQPQSTNNIFELLLSLLRCHSLTTDVFSGRAMTQIGDKGLLVS